MKQVGILYQPKVPRAVGLAEQLVGSVKRAGAKPWSCSAWDEAGIRSQVDGTEFVITLGGDGTVLRASRICAPLRVPVVAVNFGRVGFMTELEPQHATDQIGAFLNGEAWLEERLMLQATLARAAPHAHGASAEHAEPYIVLNDIVVARGAVSRMIRIRTSVDDAEMTTYSVDAVIVSTPSGSTAYSFAAGGPILHPEMENMIITPVCAHLTLARPLVLAVNARIDLEVFHDHEAGLNVDGQVEIPLHSGDIVSVSASPHRARFLRIQPRTYFYSTLTKRLRLSDQ